MSWVAILAFAIVFLSFANVLQKKLLSSANLLPVPFVITLSIFASMITAGYSFITGFESYSLSDNILNIILNISLTSVGLLALFSAFRYIEASHNAILNTSRVFFTAIGGYIFLGHNLTAIQFLGGLLILAASLIALAPELKDTRFSRKGVLLSITSAAAFGLAVINDNVLFNNVDPVSYQILGFIAPAVLLAILYRPTLKSFEPIFKRGNFGLFILITLIFTPGIIFLVSAVKLAPNTSLVGILFQLHTLMIVVLSVILLKEREHLLYKFFAVIVAMIGAGIISSAL